MDLLAKKRVLSFLISITVLFSKQVQGDVYRLKRIEFFPYKKSEQKKTKEEVFSSEELWNSKKVAELFLTNPNKETGKRYLKWQEERIKHLENAMFILDQISLNE